VSPGLSATPWMRSRFVSAATGISRFMVEVRQGNLLEADVDALGFRRVSEGILIDARQYGDSVRPLLLVSGDSLGIAAGEGL